MKQILSGWWELVAPIKVGSSDLKIELRKEALKCNLPVRSDVQNRPKLVRACSSYHVHPRIYTKNRYIYGMSRKYKFYNNEGLYFVSFATVYWTDVFIRDHYTWQLVDSLDYWKYSSASNYGGRKGLLEIAFIK